MRDRNINPVSSIKYQCGWINIWSVYIFQRILNCNLCIYEHIWYENYDFMSQKWEIIHCPHIFSTCHLWKCRHRAHVYWNLSYPLLSILKVIFLESNPLRFIGTGFSRSQGDFSDQIALQCSLLSKQKIHTCCNRKHPFWACLCHCIFSLKHIHLSAGIYEYYQVKIHIHYNYVSPSNEGRHIVLVWFFSSSASSQRSLSGP
jgi:hypothetical protein